MSMLATALGVADLNFDETKMHAAIDSAIARGVLQHSGEYNDDGEELLELSDEGRRSVEAFLHHVMTIVAIAMMRERQCSEGPPRNVLRSLRHNSDLAIVRASVKRARHG